MSKKGTGGSRPQKPKKVQRPKKSHSKAIVRTAAKRSNPKAGRKSGSKRKVSRSGKKKRTSTPRGGRPPLYTTEMGDRICARVMAGEPLRQILLLPGMPLSRGTVFEWLATYKEFSDKYARAKEIQMDAFAEEIMDIADDSRNDWLERENERTGEVKVVLNEDAIARARMRIEVRKWKMSKFAVKKFGDKLAVDHGGSVRVPMTLAEFEKRVARAEA